MAIWHQGDIVWVDLDPSLGNETKKRRPCIIVSNDQYNQYFNTCLVAPISSATKYAQIKKYRLSPLFVPVHHDSINGTALLQHLRVVDLNIRTNGPVVSHMTTSETKMISNLITQFI